MQATMRRTNTSVSTFFALIASLTACGGAESPTPAPEQNTQAAYALGMMAERSLQQLQLSPDEMAEFERGMRDYRNGTPRVTLLEEVGRVQGFQIQRAGTALEVARTQGEEFLRAAASEPDAEQLPSGIVLRVLQKGEGATAKTTERVIVKAEGTLPDGVLFFSSTQQGRAFSVDMATGIPCLTEPLARLAAGSKARITCPPQLGYAAQDRPVLIPPGAALRFEIEVIEPKPPLPPQLHG
jgi:FKBP-type peptidyl-prolyl cis-trans isomerase FkpA